MVVYTSKNTVIVASLIVRMLRYVAAYEAHHSRYGRLLQEYLIFFISS